MAEKKILWQQNTQAFLEGISRDLKYALRTLSRTPGFTLMAVLVMALGIGANAALFTVVRSVLFKPLPYKDPGRLVTLYQHDPSAKDQDNYVAAGNFADWKENSRSFESMAMVTPWAAYDFSEKGGSYPEKIDAAWCSLPGTDVTGYRLLRPYGTFSVAVLNAVALPERIAPPPLERGWVMFFFDLRTDGRDVY